MSNPLAVASVTAVLKGLLQNATTDTQHGINSKVSQFVNVTAISPSRITKPDSEEVPQLNLFLYQIAPNAALRNLGLPSRSERGDRLTNPPLALDLFYLLTAYGKLDFEAEIILGYAMQVFHEMPVLTREAVRNILAKQPDEPKAANALKGSDLADQIELIKLSPQTMNAEETSKLWTAIGTGYRPSVAYQASVVLIESSNSVRHTLPVLTLGKDDSGIISQAKAISPHPAFPVLTGVGSSSGQMSAVLGDTLNIKGYNLDVPEAEVFFMNRLLEKPFKVSPLYKAPDALGVRLPDVTYLEDPARPETTINPLDDWPAGFYRLWIIFGSGKNAISTNDLAFSLAPKKLKIKRNVTSTSENKIADISFEPKLHQGQKVSLLLGSLEFMPDLHDTPFPPIGELTFHLGSLPDGKYIARLRIDGVDSPFIDRTKKPPGFFNEAEVDIS